MHVLIHEHHYFFKLFFVIISIIIWRHLLQNPKGIISCSTSSASPQHGQKGIISWKKEDPKNKVRWLEIMNKEHKALLEKTRQAVQKEMRRKEFKDWVKNKEKTSRPRSPMWNPSQC